MEISEAIQFITKELLKERTKLIILSGSVARGKENPDDLDIVAVFEEENNLQSTTYRRNLIQRLEEAVSYKLDLIDFNEQHINDLIEDYKKDAYRTCVNLNYVCMDNVLHQWVGWPLAWIFGKEAREKLDPYQCFQDEFRVLAGEDYLEELRERIRMPYVSIHDKI